MSPAPLRLTVALSARQLEELAAGREIVMQASGAHAVIFEVAVIASPPIGPQQAAPVPVAPRPPARPAAAVPPGSRYVPTTEEEAEARAVAARIDEQRRDLGYTVP